MDVDNIDDEQAKELLKSLPIWEHFEDFQAKLDRAIYDTETGRKQLEDDDIRLKKIEESLKLTERNPTASNGASIIANFQDNFQANCQIEESADTDYDKSLELLSRRATQSQELYAMIEPDKPWIKCKLKRVRQLPRVRTENPIVTFRLSLPPDYTQVKDVDQLGIAWTQHHGLSLKPSKRVIAGPDETNLMPGIIGNIPNERTRYRYLVHFDNGSAGLFDPDQVFPIIWQSSMPWKDPKSLGTDSRGKRIHSIYNIMRNYPKKFYVNVKPGSFIDLDRDGTILGAEVLESDEDILRLRYKDGKEESVYRGSSRLMKKQREIAKQLVTSSDISHFHSYLLVFLTDYHNVSRKALGEDESIENELRKGTQTARKSTTGREITKIEVRLDDEVVSEVIENRVITNNQLDALSRAHKCDPDCLNVEGVKTESAVKDITAEFRHVSDLKVPLMLGWTRVVYKLPRSTKNGDYKIYYGSPCGKVFKQLQYIRPHLNQVQSKLDIDYFCFDWDIKLNPLVSNIKAIVYEENIAKDQDGNCLENKFISLINQYDQERLPVDYKYNNISIPHPTLARKGFSFNQEFKSSCECDNDCYERASCPCHILNEEFSDKNSHLKGTVSDKCQYSNKRLPEQVATGIFECNSMCKCSSKCNNRVVQHGIRFRLQLHMIPKKGWGVITLDEIPRGAFICTYAAELLDDADQYGDSDMYYADLDYITINESKPEKAGGYDSDEGIDTGTKRKYPSEIDEESDECRYMPMMDPERRYPSRNANQGDVRRLNRDHPFKKIHSILGSHDFTLDARIQGNLGRFLNHSCDPNCRAQNVFIETHDLRFPNVAFFAAKNIKAREEITWDYNYKMGCIEGRKIICHCQKPNCRGRIL